MNFTQKSLLCKLTDSQELKEMHPDKAYAKALPIIVHIRERREGGKGRGGKRRKERREDFSKVRIEESKKRARWMNRGRHT